MSKYNNTDEDTNGNIGWIPWSKHVLIELKRLNENDECLEQKLSDLKDEMNKRFAEVREDYLVTKEGIRIKNQQISTRSGMIAGGIISLIVTLVAAWIISNVQEAKIQKATDDIEMLLPGNTRNVTGDTTYRLEYHVKD